MSKGPAVFAAAQFFLAGTFGALLLAGCNAGSGSAPGGDAGVEQGLPPASCPTGTEARGPACLPVFDGCKDNEIALPGGGCKRVGPPTACRTGWTTVNGWCEPLLPKTTCAAGTMEVIGKPDCQPVGDCGQGTYGKIQTGTSTIFVNQAYTGGGSDGTQAKPFLTIGEAIAQAKEGTHIAVAAGEYKEDIEISTYGSITLEGRCAQMVTVSGQSTNQVATVEILAENTVLRGVTVTGPYCGVVIAGAKATVERCAIADNEDVGLVAEKSQYGFEADVTVRGCLLSDNNSVSLLAVDKSTLTVEGSAIRDTKAHWDGSTWSAFGLHADDSDIVVKDSVFVRNGIAAVQLYASQGTLAGIVITDTWDRDGDTVMGGMGVFLKRQSNVTLQDSFVARNRHMGVAALEATLQVERTVIRDTLPLRATNKGGYGLWAYSTEADGSSKLVVQDTLLANNAATGVVFNRGEATLERVVVRETGAKPGDNTEPSAIWLSARKREGDTGHHPSRVKISHSLLEQNRFMGLVVFAGSEVTVHQSTIRDTMPLDTPKESDQGGGCGLWFQNNAERTEEGYLARLTVTESLIEGARAHGVAAVCPDQVRLERTLVRDTAPQTGAAAGGVLGLYLPAICDEDKKSFDLTLKDCGVLRTSGAAIQLEDVDATLDRCVVEDTREPKGDGVSFLQENRSGVLNLTRGHLSNSGRAGVLFSGGSGTVCTSYLGSGTFSIVLDKGAAPNICPDNVYQGNKRDSVALGQNLEPAPLPPIPNLSPPSP